MSPGHFLAVYLAETDRLFRRATARAGLILAALFGLSGPIIIGLLNAFLIAPAREWVAEDIAAQGGDPAQIDQLAGAFWSWDWAVYLTYYERNFMFLPILIFLLGGLSMASEFVSRTTREDVLRPMPRSGILLAKWGALVTWILAANALTGGLSTVGGLLFVGGFELDQDALLGLDNMQGFEVVQAYVLYVWNAVAGPAQMVGSTFVTDLGFATLALAIAVITRSVAATVASLVMVFMAQLAVSIGFGLINNEFAQQTVAQQAPWLSEGAREALFGWVAFLAEWQPPFVIGTCDFAPATWQSFLTLGVITLVGLVAGLARFETMDVP